MEETGIIMTTDVDIDWSRKYAEVAGIAGARYKQDGRFFGPLGNEVFPFGDAPKEPEPEIIEPEFTGDILTLQDFDDYAEFLESIDTKVAKKQLKEFAANTLDIQLSGNRKLETFIEETRAEFKAMLESGIE